MKHFSLELYLTILEYLPYEDKIEWGSCSRSWYNEVIRNHSRLLRIEMDKWSNAEKFSKLMNMIPRLIKNPLKQVQLFLSFESNAQKVCQLLKILNYSVELLVCPVTLLRQCSKIHPQLIIKLNYFCDYISEDFDIRANKERHSFQLQCLQSLEYLSLFMGGADFPISDISTAKEVTIEQSNCPELFQSPLMFAQLRKLTLSGCVISDVSCLASIPELSLTECNRITDISALTHNPKIEICRCDGIRDFTQSFADSEVIAITSPEFSSSHAENLLTACHSWRKVKSLSLNFSGVDGSMLEGMTLSIPPTTLSFQCEASVHINPISPLAPLRELKLVMNYQLFSLANHGFERVAVIKLSHLYQLTSLTGIGSGRNRKIMIDNCPLITDYSPLRYVHEVNIDTKEKVKLEELDHVHTLRIKAKELIVDSRKSYDQIYELTVDAWMSSSSFTTLRLIYSLTIGNSLLPFLTLLCGTGTGLVNPKITITVNNHYLVTFTEALQLYKTYFAKDYSIHPHKDRLVLLRKNHYHG